MPLAKEEEVLIILRQNDLLVTFDEDVYRVLDAKKSIFQGKAYSNKEVIKNVKKIHSRNKMLASRKNREDEFEIE